MTEEKFAIPRGGPHGLGDPEDKRLRKVEKDVLIKDRVREAAKEKCKNFIDKFKECCRTNGFTTPFSCRSENEAQIQCIGYWFTDKELNERITEEYLTDRTNYRRTGIRKNEMQAVGH